MASLHDKSDGGPLSMDYGFHSLRLQSHKAWSPRDRTKIEFVSLMAKYKCPICLNVLQSPVQNACGHLYCLDCVELQLETEPAGFSCRVDKTCIQIRRETLYPDFFVHKEIQQLKVYCINKPLGCEVIISWVLLQKHEDECEFTALRLECRMKAFGCTFSGDDGQLEQHQRNGIEEHADVFATCLHDREIDSRIISDEICELRKEHTVLQMTLTNMEQGLSEFNRKITPLNKMLGKISTMSEQVSRKILVLEQTDMSRYASGRMAVRLDYEMAKLTRRLEHIHDIVNRMERERGSGPTAGRANSEVTRKCASHEAHLTNHEQQLNKIELTLNLIQQISRDGHIIWKVSNYSSKKQEAQNADRLFLESVPFFTGPYGYKLLIRVYLNGEGPGKGSHLSLYIKILKGDYDSLLQWPFKQTVTMMLMSQEPGRDNLIDCINPSPHSNSYKRPQTESNVANGFPLFARHSVVESSRFLKDDTIFLKAQIDVIV